MKINEVEKRTGLSKKAIRLYESKGLIRVERIANGYRVYSEDDVERLNRIKLLRLAGVSLSDIRLVFDGLVTVDEILEKRKSEIEEESGKSSTQYRLCEMIRSESGNSLSGLNTEFVESEDLSDEHSDALALGIDIGTTNISATVIDLKKKRQIDVYSVANAFRIEGTPHGFAMQDAERIVKRAEELVLYLTGLYPNIVCIGITGQMHGIVLTDASGAILSPLYTWQDKRGDALCENGETYCEAIGRITGETVSTGYGFATLFYNLKNGLIPEKTASFCSIMDCIAMRLTGKTVPLVHASIAASFGLFDLQANRFLEEKLRLLGISPALLPPVTDRTCVYGMWRGIPVAVAIGDNQASFLGSVKYPTESLLINIGTGSQISLTGDARATGADVEIRPLIDGHRLVCGSALCGGSAYAILERFFEEYAKLVDPQSGAQYETMNALAEHAYEQKLAPLNVDTAFYGTRGDPSRRGSVSRIDASNFSPAALTLGVIHGICRELYALYRATGIEGKTRIVASGGAIRKNAVLRKVLADTFGMPLCIGTGKEEASIGAALFAALACKALRSADDFSDFIT